MSRIFASACALLLLGGSPAWAAPVLNLPETVYNFGTVFQGETVHHTFAFSNGGDAPLTIDKVNSSCGCTAALASARTLAPKAAGELKTSFDSTRFRGEVSKIVYLYTNDPVRPMVQMEIKGKVLTEVSLEPQLINFGAVAAERTARTSIRLVNRGPREVRLAGLETTSPELAARLSAEVIPPGGAVTIAVSLTPKPGQSRFSGYVLFKAEGTIRHDLRIPVYADPG